MSNIIEFDPNRGNKFKSGRNYHKKEPVNFSVKNTGSKYDSFSLNQEDDVFDRSSLQLMDDENNHVSLTLDTVIQLAGAEKTNEIFDTFLSEGKENEQNGIISPPAGDVPLRESFKTVWNNSDENQIQKDKKIAELTRMKFAFLALENEASKNFQEKTGSSKNIKIMLKDEENECALTDILDKQIHFYRKGRLGASLDLIGKRINYGIECFIDKMTIAN